MLVLAVTLELQWEEPMVTLCVCTHEHEEEVDAEPNGDRPTSSLSKWHHSRSLRLHSCLMAGDIGAHA